jgi:hypothetical protein
VVGNLDGESLNCLTFENPTWGLDNGESFDYRGPGAEPGGRFPGSSMTTMHVRGWLGSFVRVIVGNSERTWMDGRNYVAEP